MEPQRLRKGTVGRTGFSREKDTTRRQTTMERQIGEIDKARGGVSVVQAVSLCAVSKSRVGRLRGRFDHSPVVTESTPSSSAIFSRAALELRRKPQKSEIEEIKRQSRAQRNDASLFVDS